MLRKDSSCQERCTRIAHNL